MKVLVNGGINLSELDGWWAEAYTPDVGWAVGDGREHGDDPGVDAAEAVVLYERLEREVIPEFYARDPQGIPTAWVARMRESMARLTPQFSANRTVRQYTEQYYLPMAANYRQRSWPIAGQSEAGWWLGSTACSRNGVGCVSARSGLKPRKGNTNLSSLCSSNDLEPEAVQLELYAEWNPDRLFPCGRKLKLIHLPSDASGEHVYVYQGSVFADRPSSDFTARLIPHFDGVSDSTRSGGNSLATVIAASMGHA